VVGEIAFGIVSSRTCLEDDVVKRKSMIPSARAKERQAGAARCFQTGEVASGTK
jgi:hypothetical protein